MCCRLWGDFTVDDVNQPGERTNVGMKQNSRFNRQEKETWPPIREVAKQNGPQTRKQINFEISMIIDIGLASPHHVRPT